MMSVLSVGLISARTLSTVEDATESASIRVIMDANGCASSARRLCGRISMSTPITFPLLKALGKGKVIGVDIEIRPHNRRALEAHPLASMITLIEADSVASSTVDRVRAEIKPTDKTLIILDSNHSYAHVSKELEAYSPLVSVGSYIVATDGIMQFVFDTPRGKAEWKTDN